MKRRSPLNPPKGDLRELNNIIYKPLFPYSLPLGKG